MLTLIATDKLQGKRSNDFFWTNVGEIVGFGSECDNEDVDGTCGCRRDFTGRVTFKGTTTAEVADLPMTTILQAEKDYLMKAWKMDEEKAEEIAVEAINYVSEILEGLEVGTIVEHRGDHIQVRGTLR